MELIIHGEEALFEELTKVYEEHPFISVRKANKGHQEFSEVVHLAEKPEDLPEEAIQSSAPSIALNMGVHLDNIIYCPRSPEGGVPQSLLSMLKQMGGSEYALRNRLSEFISVFHHDISEPARNMSFFAQFLNSDRAHDEEKRRDLLSRVHVSGERLQRLVADLTRYARIWVKETPAEALSSERVKEICEESFEQSKKKADRVFEHLDIEAMPALRVPSKHLSIIFKELFANALEYHGEEGNPIHVSVGLDADRKEAIFSVHDDGPGLTDPGEGRVFRPFYRGRRDDELRTGIGLALVRSLTEDVGGRVWLETKEGLETSTVYFSVPAL